MNRIIIVIVFWISSQARSFTRDIPVEYVREMNPPEIVSPIATTEVLKDVLRLIGTTNCTVSKGDLVAWALKRSHSDRPPILYEDAIFVIEETVQSTNEWIMCYVERTVCRGSPGMDVWRQGLRAPGVEWIHFQTNKPDSTDLTRFMRRSNFGKNECDPDISPVSVCVYAPFRKLVNAAERSISKREKIVRFENREGLIY
jgi:hypothetical protein